MKQLGNTILHPEVLQNSNSLLELWTEVIAEQIWPLQTESEVQSSFLSHFSSNTSQYQKNAGDRGIRNSGRQRNVIVQILFRF